MKSQKLSRKTDNLYILFLILFLMKIFPLILILILILPIASAEEFVLQKNKPVTYKEVVLKLISVGNSDSIYLQINDLAKVIEHNKELILYDLKIKNIEADKVSQTSVIFIESTAECLIDEDCKKIKPKPCVQSVCKFKNCEFTDIQGCVLKDECSSISSFENINNVLSYCSEDGSWQPRKSYKSECKYNYECLSNKCNGVCSTPIFGGEKMAPAWILILIAALMIFESLLFLFKTNKAKSILKELSFLRDKTWKIIAFVELIIAVALIVWAII